MVLEGTVDIFVRNHRSATAIARTKLYARGDRPAIIDPAERRGV
jgi:hypothetical protein